MAESRTPTPPDPTPPPTTSTSPTASSSSTPSTPRKPSGKKYRLAAGLTFPSGVATEGQVVDEEELGPGFTPQSEEDQMRKYGRLLYSEVKEGEDPKAPEPPQEEVKDPGKLKDLNDDQLFETARAEGLHYPEGTDRKIVEGAIRKLWADRLAIQETAAEATKEFTV
jgi:hypothetical protein